MSDTAVKQRAKPSFYVTTEGKAISADILDQYASKEAGSESKQLGDSFNDLYGTHGLTRPPFNPDVLAGLLELNTYHMRACKTKARDVAGSGWALVPATGKSDPSEAVRQEVTEWVNDLNTPISTTLFLGQLDYEAVGWGALEVIREDYAVGAKIVDIVHIPARTLRRHKNGVSICQLRGGRRQWFKIIGAEHDVDDKTGQVHAPGELDREHRATEIMWWVNPSPKSEWYGMPDVIPALGAIHGDLSRRDYNIAFFKNYGVPSYAVFISGDFDPGDEDDQGRTDIEKSIENHFKNIRNNPHAAMVLTVPTRSDMAESGDIKVEFKALSVETKEASFRLYRNDNRDEVLAAHAMPPYRAGISETGSLGGSTAAESTEIYRDSVVDPRQETLEALFNKHILRDTVGTTDWKFELEKIDLTDEEHDLSVQKGLFEMGAMTPRQVMRLWADRFGLDPDENPDPALDQHYVNGTAITGSPTTEEAEQVENTLKSLQARVSAAAVKAAERDPMDPFAVELAHQMVL